MNRLFPLAVLASSQLTEARFGQTFERFKAGECCPCAGPGSANHVVTTTITVTQQMPLPTDKSPVANRISSPPTRPDRFNDDNIPQRSPVPTDKTTPNSRTARPPARPVDANDDDDDDYDDDGGIVEPNWRQNPIPATQTPTAHRIGTPPTRPGRVNDGKDNDRDIRYSFNSYYTNSGNLNSGNVNSNNLNSNNANSNNANSNNANSNNANSNNANSNNVDSDKDDSSDPDSTGPGTQHYPQSAKPGSGRRPSSPSRLSPGPVNVNSPYGGANAGPDPEYPSRGQPRPGSSDSGYPGRGYPSYPGWGYPGYPGPGYPGPFPGSPFQRPRPFRRPGGSRPQPKGESPKSPTPLNDGDGPVSNYTAPKNRLSNKRPPGPIFPTTSSRPTAPARTTASSKFRTPSKPTNSSAAITSSKPTSTSTSTSSSRPKPTAVSCVAPTCGFPGVRYTRYKNPFAKDFSSTYKSFELPYFLNQRPVDMGFLGEISLVSGAGNKTYQDAALDIRASLYVCQTGKYKFYSPKSDDISILWLGERQVQNATRDNADFIQAWYGDNTPKTVEKELEAGQSLPIRVLWGNTNGAGFLNINVFGPSGKRLTDTSNEGYLWIDNC